MKAEQRKNLIKRLKKGWCNSLQAVTDCRCLKLSTRVNEHWFMADPACKGYELQRRIEGDRYVGYRLAKAKK